MNDKAIISFSSVAGKEEFLKIKSWENYDALFFIDEKNSWFNDVDLTDIISKVKHYKQVITVGNSMGAFNAVTFAEYTKVDTVIAFAPQFSINPEIVPWEKRWRHHAKKITNWKHPNLKLNKTTNYYFISGDVKKELKHLNMIPDQDNVTKIIISNADHKVALKLKLQDRLYEVITNILKGNKNEF